MHEEKKPASEKEETEAGHIRRRRGAIAAPHSSIIADLRELFAVYLFIF
jgi:hypothetical protein